MPQEVTRGKGYLENSLARQRAMIANRMIPDQSRAGCICDIGCGNHPFFLLHTRFAVKYGVDQIAYRSEYPGIYLVRQDFTNMSSLPLRDNSCDVVTMLAVIEHLEENVAAHILRDIHRILKPGGICILTTPTSLAQPVLKLMALLHLVSPVEIEEHKDVYTFAKIHGLLVNAGFSNISHGYFELFMNMWTRSTNSTEEDMPLFQE